MIHVIDDDRLCRDVFVELIQAFGFRVKCFISGNHYLEYMTLDEYQLPTVVFTDMNMPGKSGLATVCEIRKNYPDVPCYIITGNPDQLSRADVHHLNGVLHKPLPPKELQELLTSLH